MKLSLKSKYKSLEPFEFEFPDFSVITGYNGAGKTQLLNSIAEYRCLIDGFNQLQEKVILTSNSVLQPNNAVSISRSQSITQVDRLWTRYSSLVDRKNANSDLSIESGFSLSVFGATKEDPDLKTIRKIAKAASKSIEDLSQNDIYNHYPIDDGLLQTNFFQQSFATLFRRYYDKRRDNSFNKFQVLEEGRNNLSYLTDDEFIESHGPPPWEIANEILNQANLGFTLNYPVDLSPDANFDLKLTKTIDNAEVAFNELSSGEKVIMSMTLALYNSNFEVEFPSVILMDEPDASLHPSMIKYFLKVIQEVFVEKKNVRVIITTHSPTTIALAPEDAIFIMSKNNVRLQKASKDKALKILTSGLSSLSINYENRRQIFVESKNDEIYYSELYRRIGKYLDSEISLSFISSGTSKIDRNGSRIATCEQVMKITTQLRDSGNSSVWGIIDYDLKNKSSKYVKVLGECKRYSIENYLFDPILLGALLLREKIVSKVEMGLNESQSFMDFKHFSSSELQNICDFIIAKTQVHVEDDVMFEEQEISRTNDQKEFKVPSWYIEMQGHKLEDLILKSFPKLNEIKRNNEAALKKAIIEKVIDDLPEIVPESLIDIFKTVQET